MEMTTAKTIAVFAIIFGCFAVLYPKIFHPMLLHVTGGTPQKNPSEEVIRQTPPHLRRPGGARPVPGGDDFSPHMRPGPHPGLRAAAEMKKQAGNTQGGSGKGMMAVVLPMYAVGIVIYLIYTMTKVFGKGKNKEEDYMSSHFNDPQGRPGQQQQQQQRQQQQQQQQQQRAAAGREGGGDKEDSAKANKQRQRDLERLLMKADKDKISPRFRTSNQKSKKGFGLDTFLTRKDDDVNTLTDYEMQQLKKRLLETEAQMTRILAAMESVTEKVGVVSAQEEAESSPEASTPDGFTKLQPDSSPDLDTYEFVSGRAGPPDHPAAGAGPRKTATVEDIGPADSDKENRADDRQEDELEEEEEEEEGEDADAGYDEDEEDECETDEEELEVEEEMEEEMEDVVLGEEEDNEEENDEHPDLRQRVQPSKGKHKNDG